MLMLTAKNNQRVDPPQRMFIILQAGRSGYQLCGKIQQTKFIPIFDPKKYPHKMQISTFCSATMAIQKESDKNRIYPNN